VVAAVGAPYGSRRGERRPAPSVTTAHARRSETLDGRLPLRRSVRATGRALSTPPTTAAVSRTTEARSALGAVCISRPRTTRQISRRSRPRAATGSNSPTVSRRRGRRTRPTRRRDARGGPSSSARTHGRRSRLRPAATTPPGRRSRIASVTRDDALSRRPSFFYATPPISPV
jgi:hypothetical protein